MLGVMEVLGGVFVLRGIAATHVPANQAQSQMYPGVAHLYALFAGVRVRGLELDLIHVRAGFRHFHLL
jgi:hypothetical protein